jgi:hypothetical protein
MTILLYVLTIEFEILSLFDKIQLSKSHLQMCALSKCPHFVLFSLYGLYYVMTRTNYQNLVDMSNSSCTMVKQDHLY